MRLPDEFYEDSESLETIKEKPMSKGLDALHHPRIKSAKIDISAEGKHGIAYMFFDDTKQYAAIEKELTEYDLLKEHANKYEANNLDEIMRLIHNGWVYERKESKQEKALEIIKEKKVNVPSLITLFKSQTKYEDYEQLWNNDIRWQLTKNWDIQFSRKKLTQEEYDLLEEVLL